MTWQTLSNEASEDATLRYTEAAYRQTLRALETAHRRVQRRWRMLYRMAEYAVQADWALYDEARTLVHSLEHRAMSQEREWPWLAE